MFYDFRCIQLVVCAAHSGSSDAKGFEIFVRVAIKNWESFVVHPSVHFYRGKILKFIAEDLLHSCSFQLESATLLSTLNSKSFFLIIFIHSTVPTHVFTLPAILAHIPPFAIKRSSTTLAHFEFRGDEFSIISVLFLCLFLLISPLSAQNVT